MGGCTNRSRPQGDLRDPAELADYEAACDGYNAYLDDCADDWREENDNG